MNRRRLLAVLAAVVLAVVVLAGWALGRLGAPAPAFPPEGTPGAGFARDMQIHHLQAVEMSTLIRDRSDNVAVTSLARSVVTAQQSEADYMFRLLAAQ